MRRINGRVDLLSELGNFKALLKSGKVIQAEECSTLAYWIKGYNQQNYLFKTYEADNQIYRSKIIEKMALSVGIEVASTDLAYFGYYDGELTVDYRRSGYDYIPGTQILSEYLNFLRLTDLDKWKIYVPDYLLINYDEDEILNRMNNIETIELSLRHHFRKYSDCDAIVSSIVQKLKNIFCLDFFTMQRDRGHNNWEIEEKCAKSTAKLAPLIDSNRSFYYPSFRVLMPTSLNQNVSDVYEKLEYALNDEDNTYSLFYKLYEMYPPENLKQLVEAIEKENHFKMDSAIKIEILGSFQEHYTKLSEILEKRKGLGR